MVVLEWRMKLENSHETACAVLRDKGLHRTRPICDGR